MRLFIALELPPELRRAASAVQKELKPCGANVKWVETDNMHLTLKFLGEVEETGLGGIKQSLSAACEAYSPLRLGVRGCGSFPPKGNPSVVWLGLSGDLQVLARLAADIESSMEKRGFEPEKRPFKPHLTLGRVRRPRGKKKPPADDLQRLRELKRSIAGLGGYKGPDFAADRVILMMSTLTPDGPVYEPLHTVNLY